MFNHSLMRPRLIGLVLVGTAFLAGGLGGAAFDRVLSAGEIRDAHAVAAACDSHRHKGSDIFDDVGVTPEQRATIDAILQRRREETDAVWQEAGPKLRAIVASAKEEIIETTLNDAQRERYEQLSSERRARKKREREERNHR